MLRVWHVVDGCHCSHPRCACDAMADAMRAGPEILGCRRAPTHRRTDAPTDPSARPLREGRKTRAVPTAQTLGLSSPRGKLCPPISGPCRRALPDFALPPLGRPCTPHSPPPEIATAANHWGQEKSNPKPPSPSWGNHHPPPPVHHTPPYTAHPRQSPRPRYPKVVACNTLLPLSPSPFIFRPRVVSSLPSPSISLSHLPPPTLLLLSSRRPHETKRDTLYISVVTALSNL